MKITDLKPGMTVYDVHRYKMGNTTLSSVGVWPVTIVSVDVERGVVTAKWNYNAERRYFREWKSWRKKEPTLIKCGFGAYRLAKRGEGKGREE